MKALKSLLRFIIAVTLVMGVGGILVGGCSRPGGHTRGAGASYHRSSDNGTATFRIICADTSGSAESDLVKYRRFAFALVRDLRPGLDAVRVLRFDHETHEILRHLGHRKEALLGTLAAQLRVPAERPRTRIGKLYQRIAELMELPEATGKQIEVVILSDNGNDDGSAEMIRLMQSASEKIAAHPRLAKITYWGVKPRLAEAIPAAFSKLPEGVLSVQFNTEAFARR